MADSHVADKLLKLGLVKDIAHHAAAFDLVQTSLVSAGDNTSSILKDFIVYEVVGVSV